MSEERAQEIVLTVCSELEALGYKTGHEMMVLGTICAPVCEIEEKEVRAPIDLVAVIDKSGSMAGKKLEMVKQTMQFVLEQLKSSDRLGIVVYDTEVSVLAPLILMTPEKKVEMSELIVNIRSGSCTNLSGALFKGIELIGEREQEQKNEVASVLLFTDGLANVGIQKAPEIVEAMEKHLTNVKAACSVFCFGFGSDHCPELLREISGAGKGMYYFIENNDDIPQAFADCLGGLLSVYAQNLELTIETAPGVEIKQLHGSQRVRTAKIESPVTRINMGDIYSEEQRNVICMVKIPAQESLTEESQTILTFKLSYLDVVKVENKSCCAVAKITRPESTPLNQQRNIRLDIQRNRVVTTSAMEQAKQLADHGNFDQARTILHQAINHVESSVSCKELLCVGFVTDLKESLSEMENKQDYFGKGRHRMNQAFQMHCEERAIHSKEYYMNKKKGQMKKAYHQRKNEQKTGNFTVSGLATAPGQKVKLIVGNRYRSLPTEEWEDSTSSPDEGKNKHLWTLFVEMEGNNQQDHIDKVEFHLDQTFSNPIVTVTSSPFQIERKGWGTFLVKIVIHFKQNTIKPLTVFHELVFNPLGRTANYEITL